MSDIKKHAEYGEPIQIIEAAKPNAFFRYLALLFGIAFLIGSFCVYDDPKHGNQAIFIFLASLIFLCAAYKEKYGDFNQVKLIVYEKGLWCRFKILGSKDNFIPWSDIDFVQMKNHSTKIFLNELPGPEFIVIHVLDKNKYYQNMSFFERIIAFFEKRKMGAYHTISIGALDIPQFGLYQYINTELEKRQIKNADTK